MSVASTPGPGAITLGAAGAAALIRNLNPATRNSLILSGGISGTNRDLTVAGAGNTLISSALATGTGNLRKQSAGTLTLSGTNTYTGKTDIDGGTLAITGSGALGAGTVTVNRGGVLALSSDPDADSRPHPEPGADPERRRAGQCPGQ